MTFARGLSRFTITTKVSVPLAIFEVAKVVEGIFYNPFENREILFVTRFLAEEDEENYIECEVGDDE